MTIFFTSDTHFGHARIIELSNRPFADVHEMNEAIISRWNSIVKNDDLVIHLGDVALGPIKESLPLVSRLKGTRILVNGNHDRPFMNMGKARFDEWVSEYDKVFHDQFHGQWAWTDTDGTRFVLSHFPYTGDHTPEDRHTDARPVDNGEPLIHGHTHSTDRLTFSNKGTPQIHVGQDAWDFYPVSLETIRELL